MNFLNRFSKSPQMPNFMNIRLMGAEFHADGRTDMTKLIVAFRNFAKAPKNGGASVATTHCIYFLGM